PFLLAGSPRPGSTPKFGHGTAGPAEDPPPGRSVERSTRPARPEMAGPDESARAVGMAFRDGCCRPAGSRLVEECDRERPVGERSGERGTGDLAVPVEN